MNNPGDKLRFKQDNGIEVAIELCSDGIRVKAESGQLDIFPDGDFMVAIKAIDRQSDVVAQLANYDWRNLPLEKIREVWSIVK